MFTLPAGNYYIGDPLLFLHPDVISSCFTDEMVTPGLYRYKSLVFLIDCTGFDEGSFTDIDQNEYIIYNGMLGIMPIEICRDPSDMLHALGRHVYYPVPFTVETDGYGLFELTCYNYTLKLDTSMGDYTSDDSI